MAVSKAIWSSRRNRRYYRYLFLIAAFWNWIVAAALWCTHEWLIEYLRMPPLRHVLPLQIALALVFVYGIGYYYLFKDPVKNMDIAKLGIFGKASVFFILLTAWRNEQIVFVLLIPGIVDLIFAAFFFEFLISAADFTIADKCKAFRDRHPVLVRALMQITHSSQ